jgi:1-acyl-sn-glycerol-3-phosphate acyltransferase
MFRAFSKFIFWLIGWKVTGHIPGPEVKKSIFVAIPHTSNWDFPLGIFSRSIIKTKVTYMMKSTMFKPPFGWFFRMLDGIPVERSKSTNFVDGVIKLYNSRETLHTVIAPEGTRGKVKELKSGFYFMALGANVPLILTAFDYSTKEVRFSKPLYMTGNKEEDFEMIRAYFANAKGKYPELGWPQSITMMDKAKS